MAEFLDTKLLAIKCESCLFAPDPNKLDDINRFLQNPNVRFNLLKFTESLMFNCNEKFILNQILTLFKVPLNYIGANSINGFENEHDEMNELCKHFQENFQTKILEKSIQFDVTNILHKELFDHLTRMPYSFRNIDIHHHHPNKIVTKTNLKSPFQILVGFLHTLNQYGINDFLKLEQHNHHLFRTFINLGEFDFKHSKFLPQEFVDNDADFKILEKY
ncbi:hypothetical protein DERF_008986 [Dermatophagoides farinae]|uniref:Uncharacterized protein n=1 Tax=Dermatophagoides farinae TaxID=6954 RepID=A0A922HT46_DERFA|nr:hypothetical protein DERF_008986 [Dermatophagoides farinae]